MKKPILFLFVLCLNLALHAQDDSYAGPAKIYVKSFWTQIDKLKNGYAVGSTIMSAERAINNTKDMDPGYNVSDMEAALKPWKEKAGKEQDEKNANATKANDENEYFKHFWGQLITLYTADEELLEMPTGSDYYEKAKAMDPGSYPQKKAAATGKGSSYIRDIDKILADYDAFLDRTGFIKNLRPASVNANTPAEKTKKLTEMKMQCEAALLFSPNNAAAKQKLADINKFMGAADTEMAKYFTSDFHKTHVNQIVWSSKPLVVGKENEMSAFIKDEFKSGEYVYGTIYLARNVKDAQNSIESLPVKVSINNGSSSYDSRNFILPLALQNRSYFQFALIPDPQWVRDNHPAYVSDGNWTISRLINTISNSGDDKNEIICEITFRAQGAEKIQSKFSLDLSSGSKELKALDKQLHDILFTNIKLPQAGMNNPGLESQMLTVANKLGWAEHFTKAIITSQNWTIEKNSLTGVILRRYIVGICTSTSAAGVCSYQDFTFNQEYTGGGNYSSSLSYGSYGGKHELGCDKIK